MARKEEKAKEPEVALQPQTASEYVERGWMFYSKDEYTKAVTDFQKALELNPKHSDTLYALGLALHAAGQSQEAIQAFEETIVTLKDNPDEERARASMLERMARGHINRIKTGEWKLDGTV